MKLKNPLNLLSSVKITVVCLFLLFVLTFWGTVAQIDQGLYLAQKRFFHSWYFLALGFIPFPGAQGVLWVLFVNLVCVAVTRFRYDKQHLGILMIHLGLLMYFVSAFVIFHVTEESNLTLAEGEGANVSTYYHEWELSVWEKTSEAGREVWAQDVSAARVDTVLAFPALGFSARVDHYLTNADAFISPPESQPQAPFYKNVSGISLVNNKRPEIEPEKNVPAVKLTLKKPDGEERLLLYGAENKPAEILIDNSHLHPASLPNSHLGASQDVRFFPEGKNEMPDYKRKVRLQLRRKRAALPFTLVLKDFTRKMHPGTDVASAFESLVEIRHDGLTREQLIYMNHPLQFKEYTFYQASYSTDDMGREYSTLAVVKNYGRLLPYVSSLFTFAGLVFHFLWDGLKSSRRKSAHA